MKTTRTQPENFWRGMGRRCAMLGWPIERVLTGRLLADGWIREGYKSWKRPEREAR